MSGSETDRSSERGQVIPLFVLFLVVLLGFAALAVDVSGAYSARRFYGSAADAAALAGAQDLQEIGSRTVSSTDRIRARGHAMASLVSELGISGSLPAACTPSGDVDVTDSCVLPGTSFHVSITTPVPACQDCDPDRAVQVGLRNATYQLTFARVLGQTTWSVGVTSVAGLTFGRAYAIETLRPPKSAGSTFDVKDIWIKGGSVVNVQTGDVGTNSNMEYDGIGTGSVLNLDPGYGMYYFDPFDNPLWWPGPPIPPGQIVKRVPTLIPDPMYNYPAMSGSLGSDPCGSGLPSNCAPTFTDASEPSCTTAGANRACSRADLDPACLLESQKVDATRYSFMATQASSTIYCYNPGIYNTSNPKQLAIGTGHVGLLKPGAYYFESGLAVGGRLIGGYQPSAPGVALMFDECSTAQCIFNGNNAATIALNAGTKFPPGSSGGAAAQAALDWNNLPVQTSGPASPTPAILITLLVNKDPSCFVPTSPPYIEPAGCDPGTHDKTLNMAGGGSLALEGVQYAPTDNVAITGGSTGAGHIGQIVSWTLFYSGGTNINQQGPSNQGPGTLRLDGACTAPSTPCSP